MKNKTCLLLLFGVVLLTIASCYKKKKVKPTHVDIYFAGSSALHQPSSALKNDIYIATYWKNGVSTVLKGDTINDSNANGIAICGSDVYVVGDISVQIPNSYIVTDIATYWKNGAPHKLGQGTISAIATKGKDVYMVGTSFGFGDDKMAIWKNGVLDTLGNGEISSIAIDGDDIYMAGFQTMTVQVGDTWQKTNVAVYWKNGKLIYFNNNEYYPETMATKIFVKNGDAYIAGFRRYQTETPLFWKNRDSVTLSSRLSQLPGNAYGIFAADDTVYAAGLAYASTHNAFTSFEAVYWQNGTIHHLSHVGERSLATDINIINNDVYIAGEDDYPVYWKNGKRIQLGNAKGKVSGMALVAY
jgi:hypothetical protein